MNHTLVVAMLLSSWITTSAFAPAITEMSLEDQASPEDLIRSKAIENQIDPNLAVKIASCESSLRQYDSEGNVLKGQVNNRDSGLFQINETYHLEKSTKLGMDIYTPEGNVDYAMYLLKTQGTTPWKYSKNCWSVL